VDDVLMQGFNGVVWLISLVMLALAVFAFIDGLVRRDDAYRAASKQTKAFWLILLGLTIAVGVFHILFLQVPGLVATIVYIVDVRPAVRQISGGGPRRRGGSSSDGPYGPFNGR
jgi:UDP-N-acetylmuramyl pentapeptide phosphotransferase/UDP-N-acetylglucosamine-1-phosphate transferase